MSVHHPNDNQILQIATRQYIFSIFLAVENMKEKEQKKMANQGGNHTKVDSLAVSNITNNPVNKW